MNYYELLRSYIERSGLSLSEISEKLNGFGYKVSKGYISQLQNGKTGNPATIELNRALAKVTNGNVEELLTAALIEKAPEEIKDKFQRLNKLRQLKNECDEITIKESQTNYITEQFVKVPLVSYIKSGQAINEIEVIESYEYVDCSTLQGTRGFALKIEGDSMTGDMIADGDIVICIEQNEVTSDDIAVVATGSNDAIVVRVKRQGDMCILIPSNPKAQPSLVKYGEIKILGKVVEIRRKI